MGLMGFQRLWKGRSSVLCRSMFTYSYKGLVLELNYNHCNVFFIIRHERRSRNYLIKNVFILLKKEIRCQFQLPSTNGPQTMCTGLSVKY
jgi:hypothetical protein